MQLREYQVDALNRTRTSFAKGRKAPILVAPTGSGKTVMACSIIEGAIGRGREVMFLAHRFELISQASMKLATFGIEHEVIAPEESVRAIKMDHFRMLGRSFVVNGSGTYVGTVQTMSRRLMAKRNPGLIIIDECHLSIAPTYRKVVEHYPKALLLGLTATPTRLDKKGLGVKAGGLYDDLVILCQPDFLVGQGFLVDPRIYAAREHIDLSGLKTIRGDYDQSELASRVDKPKLIGDVVENWRRIAQGRPTIAFCVSVKHAEHLADEFNAQGIRAIAVNGDTDPGIRADAIRGLADGRFEVVCNCGLFIEGMDQPCISAVILSSPTKSLTRYLQSVGRGLRPHPESGKVDCIILDHAGCVAHHGFPTDEREWSLEGQKARKSGKKDDDPDVKIATCPDCFTIHKPAPFCPTCGHAYAGGERQIEQVAGELVELTTEDRQRIQRERKLEEAQAKSFEDLVELGRRRGYHPKWAERRYQARMRRTG